MTSLIINPKPLHGKSEVLKEIKSWLQSTQFPIGNIRNDNLFISKWKKLDEEEYVRVMFKVILMVGIPFMLCGYICGFIFGRL